LSVWHRLPATPATSTDTDDRLLSVSRPQFLSRRGHSADRIGGANGPGTGNQPAAAAGCRTVTPSGRPGHLADPAWRLRCRPYRRARTPAPRRGTHPEHLAWPVRCRSAALPARL